MPENLLEKWAAKCILPFGQSMVGERPSSPTGDRLSMEQKAVAGGLRHCCSSFLSFFFCPEVALCCPEGEHGVAGALTGGSNPAGEGQSSFCAGNAPNLRTIVQVPCWKRLLVLIRYRRVDMGILVGVQRAD